MFDVNRGELCQVFFGMPVLQRPLEREIREFLLALVGFGLLRLFVSFAFTIARPAWIWI